MDSAIQTEHLTKIYRQRLIAVNDLELTVPQGAIFGLLGPNGAGKTTTLNLLLGLQKPTAGRALVFGKPCGPNAVQVRARIGYLPTNPRFPENLRPIEYLDLVGRLCRLPTEVRQPRISSLLRSVGLLGATDQRISTFSTGMRTRLGIAASLVGDPPLLLWDEPTAGLDPAARLFTLDLIRKLGKTKTVFVATHILSDIDRICNHLGVMHEGRMIFSGTMEEMKRKLRHNDFSLELDAKEEDLKNLAEEIEQMEGVAIRIDPGQSLLLQIEDSGRRAHVLANILSLIERKRLPLRAINSGQNATENAYLQLLQEEENHGFKR